MNRRSLLATLGAASLGGCTAGYVGRSPPRGTVEAGTLAEQGFPSTVCEEELKPNLVDAIDDPVFASDWSDPRVPEKYRRTGGLTDDRQVVGIERDGIARAYPLDILRRNEVVNDTFEVPPPRHLLPGLPVRARRPSRGRRRGHDVRRSRERREWDLEGQQGADLRRLGTALEAAGRLRDASEADGDVFVAGEGLGEDPSVRNTGNLVLYDFATRSRWSQLMAWAICGPLTGTDFEILPSTVTTWGEWKAEYPETEVLFPASISGTLSGAVQSRCGERTAPEARFHPVRAERAPPFS